MTQSAELSKRTPEEIFAHHAQALGAEDLDATELDYADSAYLITSSGENLPYAPSSPAYFRRFLKRNGMSRRPMLKISCSSNGLPAPGLLAYPMVWIPLSLRMG